MLSGISALVMSISLERLVKRQSREIAVLRTIGVKSPALLMSYLTVPAFHGLVGGAIGIWLGRYMSTEFTTWYFDFLSGIPVVAVNHHNDVGLGVLVSVLAILLLFGMLPARKAIRISPLEVMREQAGAKPNPFVAWATSGLPPSLGLGFRSTFRNPGRLLMTVLGLGLSLIIVSGMMMVTEGMLGWMNEANDAETWDMQVGLMNPLKLIRQMSVDANVLWQRQCGWSSVNKLDCLLQRFSSHHYRNPFLGFCSYAKTGSDRCR